MEWYTLLSLIVGGLLFFMAIGIPVAFSFILVTTLGVIFLQGGGDALRQIVLSMYSSVSSFTLVPIPLFIFMGLILWHSNLGQQAVDALDKWMGRIPGRLSILTVASGTAFSSLSGSTMANTAMLGTMLMPELERRGYSRSMAMGPIMAAGGLAMMIPPSALAVILASVGKLSIAKILIGAIVPGLLMGVLYAAYIVGRAVLQPSVMPGYDIEKTALGTKIWLTVRDLLPLGLVVFAVTGVIIFGIATPTEAAALGAVSAVVLATLYRRLSWQLLRVSLVDSMRITVMTLAVMATALGFSQILAFSGATSGFMQAVIGNEALSPIMVVAGFVVIVMVLGCFMEQISIMLITLPIFLPVVSALQMDPVWFGIVMLIALETALMTPPFGLLLFVMKGVAPPGTSFALIYLSALPFVLCNLLVLAVMFVFPEIVTSVLTLADV